MTPLIVQSINLFPQFCHPETVNIVRRLLQGLRDLLLGAFFGLDFGKCDFLRTVEDAGPYNRAFKHRLGYELRNIAYLIIVCANRRDRRPGGPQK